MFAILNRLRGTIGAYAKVIGLGISYLIMLLTLNPLASLSGVGYILGETAKGWGEEVGDLTQHRLDVWKSRFRLFIRGLIWYVPTILPLYFIDFNIYFLLSIILFLSVSFPLACEIGYLLRDKSFKILGLSYSGGWEIQEGFTGLSQDIAFIALILYWLLK